MKGFFVLLILSAAGLAGVLYWRQHVQVPRAPVTAAAPSKAGNERRHRRRRGARRLARNEVRNDPRNDVFVASASPDEAPPDRGASQADVPSAPSAERPPPEERAPIAPGGSSTTEVAPDEVFGALSSPSAQAPSGGSRQPVEREPIKLRAADLKLVWQGEDLSRPEVQRLDLSSEDGHELSENEIDARFRAKEDAVLGCIARARPDEDTYLPGRVTVRFRIQKTGAVKGVQVEAPVILHKGGLLGCIRGVMGTLRFPASSSSQVITYPYSLM
jgi:hypothetical protein